MGLAACAAKAPRPPLKPNPMQKLAMLPLIEHPVSGGIIPFARSANQLKTPQAGQYIPINPSTLGLAIGSSIRASRDAEYNALSLAVHSIEFEPLPRLKSLLDGEIARRGLILSELADPAVSSQIRSNKFDALPVEFDGIIDVQIHNVGYYDLGRRRGFSPYYYVGARVLDVKNPGEVVEDWSYSGTSVEKDETAHDYFLPASLVQPNLDAFRTNAAYLIEFFTRLLERTAKQIVDDVVQLKEARSRAS